MPRSSPKLRAPAAWRSGIEARIGARARSATSIVVRAPRRWTTAPLGMPSTAVGRISAARTSDIFPGEPVVTRTNHGSARYVIRVPRTENGLGGDERRHRASVHTGLRPPAHVAEIIKRPYGFVK